MRLQRRIRGLDAAMIKWAKGGAGRASDAQHDIVVSLCAAAGIDIAAGLPPEIPNPGRRAAQ